MKNAKQLAMRDVALAAVLGAELGSSFGGEFGDDVGIEGEFGDEVGIEGDVGIEGEFGADVGAEFGGRRRHHHGKAPAEKAMLAALWAEHKRRQAHRHPHGRLSMLEPNAGSPNKIQRYAFSIPLTTAAPLFGTASAPAFQGNPRVTIRPKRLVSNVPVPGLLTLLTLEIANINAFVGSGPTDAYMFNANAMDSSLDLPTITPAYPVSVQAAWSSLVPTGYTTGAFITTLTLVGPAEMVG